MRMNGKKSCQLLNRKRGPLSMNMSMDAIRKRKKRESVVANSKQILKQATKLYAKGRNRCSGMNQMVDSINGSCICGVGYVNISNFCIQCPSGTVYLNGQCTPTSCQTNQVLSNGKCICDQWSVKVGSVCVACSLGSFPNNITSSCDNCISNCNNCTNITSCDLCASGYVFDYLSRSCIQNAGIKGGVSVRNGFPVYTATAVVTDFVVESIATMAFKNRQQLAKIVSI